MQDDAVTKARILLDVHQADKARDLALAALRLDPTDGVALFILARTSLITGDLAEAEKHFRASTADPASRAEAFHELSKLLSLTPAREGESAEAAFAAVQLDPQDWRYRNNYAQTLRESGDTAGAMREADAALRLAPIDPAERTQAMSRIGLTLLRLPTRNHGLSLIAEATALDPTDASLQMNLLTAQASTKSWAAALPTAAAYSALEPTSPLPPLIARVSVFMLTRRVLGWMALIGFVAPMTIAPLGANPELSNTLSPVLVRAYCLLAVLGFLLVCGVVFRPLASRSGVRALWLFARRSALAWFGAVTIAVCVICYLLGLIMGPAALVIPMLPLIVFPVAWWLHGWGVHALRMPDVQTLIAQHLR